MQKKTIFIGLPCSGKTTYSKFISYYYNTLFIDTDSIFEEKYFIEPHKYIDKEGKHLFREKEYEILCEIIKDDKYKIIATGGGIVEYYKSYNLLLELKDNDNYDIIFLDIPLKLFQERYYNRLHLRDIFKTFDDIEIIYKIRYTYYETLCNYKFLCSYYTINENNNYLVRFLKNINEKTQILPNSLFTCIPINEVNNNIYKIKNLKNCDAIELRLDYEPYILNNISIIEEIIFNVFRNIDIPLILTIRSKNEWGFFEGSDVELKKIIDKITKLGANFIDHELKNNFIIARNNYNFNIILSCHTNNFDILRKNLIYKFEMHNPDILKIVVTPEIYELSKKFVNQYKVKKILICIGTTGSRTRITNKYLTPVKCDFLKGTAPGQLTSSDIIQSREFMYNMNQSEFYLFGNDIQKSPSPFIHNYVFDKKLNNATYELFETNYLNNIKKVLFRENFKGASVTMPFKNSIIYLLDDLTHNAKTIKSVNTIYRTNDNKLIGENTDWKAIYDTINNILKNNSHIEFATVLGNGGTSKAVCYALNKLNIPILVKCRNIEKARNDLIKFDINCFDNNFDLNQNYSLIINCLPPEVYINYEELQPNSYLINMGYLKKNNDKIVNNDNINIIDGYNILVKQAIYQYKFWYDTLNDDIFVIYENAMKEYFNSLKRIY